MSFVAPTAKEFINAFYSLFSEWENECFIGSKEQLRLLLQLKLQCYIPQTYTDNALKTFIGSGTVKKLDKTVEIERKIGRKYFRRTAQQVYQKKEEEISMEELEKLEFVFQNFPSAVSELTKEKDVIMLRSLEKEKQITIGLLVSGYPGKSKYRNKQTNDDLFWLYYVPRCETLVNIQSLKDYDREKALAKRREIENRNNIEKQIKDEAFDKVYTMGQKLISKSISISGIGKINIESNLNHYLSHSKEYMGHISPQNLIWCEDGILKLIGQEINFEIPIYDYLVLPKTNELLLLSNSLRLIFSVDPSLNDMLEMLKLYKDKVRNEFESY